MSVTANFVRNSIAYMTDGTQVAANVPRYEPGRFGQAVMVEEGTTNLDTPDPSFESGVDGFVVVGSGGAISSSTDWRIFGNKSLKVVTDGSYAFVQATKSYGDKHGQTLTVSIYAYTPTGSRVRVEFYDHTNRAWLNGVTRDMAAGEVYRFVVTQVVPANCTDIGLYLRPSFGIAQAKTVYFDGLLLEQKPYATSFIDGTRAAESLTIPTAGVLNPQEGTVECRVYVNNLIKDTSQTRYVFYCYTDDLRNGIALYRITSGRWKVITVTNGSEGSSIIADDTLSYGWHYFAVRWCASGLALFIDGVKLAEDPYPILPTALGSLLYLGRSANSETGFANTLFDDLRISSRARTDEEIAAAYQSGQPLPKDQYTTCKLTFDTTLRDKTDSFKVFDNTPDIGYIAWQDVGIRYKGITYDIADGNTNKKYVWWDYDYPTVFQTSDSVPELTDDDCLVFFNKNGTHLTVPTSTVVDGGLIVPESILADALAANCVTGVKILAGSISADKIAAGAIGAEKIATGAVISEKIAAGAVTADKINVNELSAISANLGEVTAGRVETDVLVVNKSAGSIVDFITGYGDGSDGVLNTSMTIELSEDDKYIVVKQFESINLPQNAVLTVNKRCCGLILYSRGDVIINGKIDLRGKASKIYTGFPPFLPNRIIAEIVSGGNGGSGGAGGKGGSNTGGAGGAGALGSVGSWFGGGWGGAGGGGGGGGYATQYTPEAKGGTGGAAGPSNPNNPIGVGGTGGTGNPATINGGQGGNFCGGGGGGSYLSNGDGGGGGAGIFGGKGGRSDVTQYPPGMDGDSGGGFGGASLILIAKGNVTIGSTGIIDVSGANGGAGGNGGTYSTGLTYPFGGGGGGQGGGGGGSVLIVHSGNFNNFGSILVNGGAGGSGGATDTRGGAQYGVSGTAGSIGIIKTIKL